MKIQNRSVLNTGIWKVSDMSQVEDTHSVRSASQTESVAKLPTEAQRNQQIYEFKSQEELLRANLQNQLPSAIESGTSINGKNLDKQMDRDWEDLDTVPELDRAIDALVIIKSEILQTGHSDRLDASYLPRIEELLVKLEARRDATQALMDASLPIERGNDETNNSQRRVIPRDRNRSNSRLNGEGPESNRGQRDEQHGTTAQPPSIDRGTEGRWRRPGRNPRNSDNQNNGAPSRNQKSDSGPRNVEYSSSTNTSNESRESPEPIQTTTEAIEKKEAPKSEKKIQKASMEVGQDPSTGQGGSAGNDIGASGRIPKGSPDNRSGIQQMVQPGINLFSTTTGVDDKERPNTGSSTTSNSAEGNDLGDDLPYDLSRTGGSIDIEAGKVLLEQYRPINPGGPDPTKTKVR